jgi:hypothetical protein
MGWVNRLAEDGEELEVAIGLAEHLMTIRRQTLLHTIDFLRRVKPRLDPAIQEEGAYVRLHGVDGDIMETRRVIPR